MIKINLVIHTLNYLWKGVLLVLILLFFGLEIYTLFTQNYEGNIDLPQQTGNFAHVREILAKEQQKDEFCFAVIGDTQSHGTFEQIAKELRSEPLSFAVFLGDFVRKGTEGNHNYFKSEYATEFDFPFPTFFVVGNHDIDKNNFPLSRFEEIYGPSIFSFEYQKCLFVILRTLNEPYSNEESLQFLEKLISKKDLPNYNKIFVFMHIPPPISSDFKAREFKGSLEIVSFIEKLKANYVIAGDYHGYARIAIRNTVYLITGGGGAHLEEGKFGQFHHALVLKLTKNAVSEKILMVNRKEELGDRIESLVLADIYPWMKNNLFAVSFLNIIALLCGFKVTSRTLRNGSIVYD